jgi:hypothetical protein
MTSQLPRRTIPELLTRYRYKPHFRDVFVEGPSDVRVFRQFLSQFNLNKDVVIYPIETVEVPRGKVMLTDSDSEEGDGGNKVRVVALALALTRGGTSDCDQASCIADADFDHFLDRTYPSNSLLLTDFTSSDLYLFAEGPIDKVTNMYCGDSVPPAAILLEKLSPVLIELFSIRVTARLLNLDIPWMTPERCCILNGDNVIFDRGDFVTRFLNKGARGSIRPRFEEELAKVRERPMQEPRNVIRGHDFLSLLTWYLQKRCNGFGLTDLELRNSLWIGTDLKQLADFRMFNDLLKRITPGGSV